MNFKYRLIIIIKILLLYAPNFIKKLVANYNHKKLITKAKKNFKISISKESIENIFSSVQFDTDVFIHTSMTSIGNIEGGKDEVVRLFNKYILDKGNTMLFSALAIRGSSEDFLKKNHYCPISSFNTFNIIQLQTTSPTFFYNTQIYGYQSIV